MDLLLTVRAWLSNFTEGLANLTVKSVLMAVGVMLLILVVRRLTETRNRHHDWVVENVQVVLSVVVVVFLIIRPFLFQAFYIPSGSMEPTLMGPVNVGGTGDRLLVNKLVYRVSDPDRFDIAVFKAPPVASPDEKEFIKRVIGLPGETIEVVPPRVLVDGKPVLRMTSEGDTEGVLQVSRDSLTPKIQENQVEIDAIFPSYTNAGVVIMARPDAAVVNEGYRVLVDGRVVLEDGSGRIQEDRRDTHSLSAYGWDPKLEGRVFSIDGEPRLAVVSGKKLTLDPGHVLINGKTRLKEPYIKEAPRYALQPQKLGPNMYFMMGDNRNNSNDSHSWGPLERDRIIGRAEILFWPVSRINILHWWLLSVMGCLFVAYYWVQRWFAGARFAQSQPQ